jgi:hypothetical protein
MGKACDTYGDMSNAYRILLWNVKEWDYWEELRVDGKIILK